MLSYHSKGTVLVQGTLNKKVAGDPATLYEKVL